MGKLSCWLASALLAFSVSAANATTFNWSYTSDIPGVSGSGTLEANETSPGSGIYTLISIFGTANGFTLTGALSGYAGAGTTLYYESPVPSPFFFTDFNGFGFLVGSGTQAFALYEDAGGLSAPTDSNGDPLPASPYACNFAPYCLLGPGDPSTDGLSDTLVGLTSFVISPVDAEVPVPAALPLFAGGLGLIGLMARRRRQKAAAAG